MSCPFGGLAPSHQISLSHVGDDRHVAVFLEKTEEVSRLDFAENRKVSEESERCQRFAKECAQLMCTCLVQLYGNLQGMWEDLWEKQKPDEPPSKSQTW